jgi:hypothetical protein
MAKAYKGAKDSGRSAKNTPKLSLFLMDDETHGQVKDQWFVPHINGEIKAHGLIPRDYRKYPAEMFDPPSQLKVYPRDQWESIAKGKDAEKSWLTDLRDIGNAGPMLYSTNRRVDFGVTPDHQMYVRKWDERRRTLSDRYSFTRAADLGWYCGLMAAPNGQIGTELVELEIPGDRRYDGDDLLALLGLVASDGYAGGTENTNNWVSFASFREEVRPAIAALAARVGFHESPSRRGVWVRYDAGALAAWLRENAYAGGKTGALYKRVPSIVKEASPRQIKHFLHWFDDRNRSGNQFYSASKYLIDDIQDLLLRVGKRGRVAKVPAKDCCINGKKFQSKDAFVVTVAEGNQLCLDRKKHIETERYKGLVYCAGVPNHTLITRRNGSVLISSNCWAHSSTHCAILDRAKQGLPYVPLSAFMVAATIKSGRDEGGWCGLSAKFIRERGVCSQALWPQGDRNVGKYANNPAVAQNALLHKVTEEWVDLTRDVYNVELTFDQVATCMLISVPCAVDFNWWSHSVCAVKIVLVEAGSWGLAILNSWSDQWGEKGVGILRGSKAIPNSAVAFRATSGAAA